MGISTGVGLLISGLAGAGTGVVSGVLGSNASQNAANTQSQADQAAVAEQEREFNVEQQNESPWINAGEGALNSLVSGIKPGGGLADPFTQAAPTFDPNAVQFDPGYAYRIQQANQAIQQTAAARGELNSGGALMAVDRNTQNLASQEYQNAYGRDVTTYQNQLQGYQTAENTFYQNQANQFNRLASVAGVGQTAVAGLNQAGQASTAAQTELGTASAAAQAAGTVGSTNAITSGLTGASSSLSSNLLLSQLLGLQAKPAGLNPGYTAPVSAQ